MTEANQAGFLAELQDIRGELIAFLFAELGHEIRPTRAEWLAVLTGKTDFNQGNPNFSLEIKYPQKV